MAYSYLGGFQHTGGTNVITASVTIPAGNFVVVWSAEQASTLGPASVVAGATTLTKIVTDQTQGAMYVGSCPGGASSVVVTGSTGNQFNDLVCGIWTWPGSGTLGSSGGGASSATGNFSPSPTAGDYVFFGAELNVNFTGSTQTPTDAGPGTPYTIVGGSGTYTVADWLVAATGTFQITISNFTNLVWIVYTPIVGGPVL